MRPALLLRSNEPQSGKVVNCPRPFPAACSNGFHPQNTSKDSGERVIFPKASLGLVRKLPFSARQGDHCQRCRERKKKKRSARWQERSGSSHEVDLSEMVRRPQ